MIEELRKKKSRRMLLLLLCVFMAPLAFAFWLYYGTAWRPLETTNNGQLISPARPLPSVALPRADRATASSTLLRDKWSLVVIATGDCNQHCTTSLDYATQTVAGLGRLQSRMQRVLLVNRDCCNAALVEKAASGLLVLDASETAAASLLANFPADDRERMIFIIDPLGNLMMQYDTRLEPKGLRADLKHLLDLSEIG